MKGQNASTTAKRKNQIRVWYCVTETTITFLRTNAYKAECIICQYIFRLTWNYNLNTVSHSSITTTLYTKGRALAITHKAHQTYNFSPFDSQQAAFMVNLGWMRVSNKEDKSAVCNVVSHCYTSAARPALLHNVKCFTSDMCCEGAPHYWTLFQEQSQVHQHQLIPNASLRWWGWGYSLCSNKYKVK